MFRKMVLPGLIAYGVLCGMAASSRVGRAAARPVTPARDRVSLATALAHLPPSFPLSTTSLMVWNYHLHIESWSTMKHKHRPSVCALK